MNRAWWLLASGLAFACDAPHHATQLTADLTDPEAANSAQAGAASARDTNEAAFIEANSKPLDGERGAWRFFYTLSEQRRPA